MSEIVEKLSLDIKAIQKVLPHRYPFIMLDKVTEVIAGKSAEGFKNITINEPQFQGHFPDLPIMPGMLQLEAAAQLSCIVMLMLPEYQNGYMGLFTGLDTVKFRRIVVPGDKLIISTELKKFRYPFGKFDFRASVENELSAEGCLSFAMSKIDSLS